MSSVNKNYLFTSESVTEGHPDKIADQISDAVLDAFLAQDPMSRVACETLLTTGLIMVAGEITSKGRVEIDELARRTVTEIGYTRAKFGFDAETCGVITAVHRQSPDISMGVDTGGAGDQGLMFGYACDETPELMPLTISLAPRVSFQRCGKRAFCLTFGLTASPRSPSSTSRGNPTRSTPWWSRASTALMWSRSRSARTSSRR
jgi:S-adenosylmethionine synthetase